MARTSRRNEDEEDRLIESRYGRKKIFNTKNAIICFCICVVLLLFCAVISAVFARRHKSTSHFDFGLPQNLSDFQNQNDMLCGTVGNRSKSHESTTPSHIYIVKVTTQLTAKESCGVESVLRLFPDKTVYLIDFYKDKNGTAYERCSTPPNYLGLLSYLYKDRLQLVSVDRKSYFKNTPISNFSESADKLEFLAILLTAYKYGGFVASTNIVLNSRDFMECFPEETVVEPFAILSSRRCDRFLYYLMQSFNLCGPGYNSTLEEIIRRSVELYTSTSTFGDAVRRTGPHEVCHSPKEFCNFLKLKEFQEGDAKSVCELSKFCKQVVQAFLGIKINQMEVEEETFKMKSHIESHKKTCKPHQKSDHEDTC